MTTVRTLLSALMMVLMLPWGAYAAGIPAAVTPAAVAADKGPAVQVAPEASAKRKCHRTMPIGAPCGPDRVLPAPALAVPEGRSGAAVRPGGDWTAHDILRDPSRDPPRSI